MFEHMKNYKTLMSKIASWLRPNDVSNGDQALFFCHIFCHRTTPYHFGESDGWMAQMFFTGEYLRSVTLSVHSHRPTLRWYYALS